jgi:hypothetical protein
MQAQDSSLPPWAGYAIEALALAAVGYADHGCGQPLNTPDDFKCRQGLTLTVA